MGYQSSWEWTVGKGSKACYQGSEQVKGCCKADTLCLGKAMEEKCFGTSRRQAFAADDGHYYLEKMEIA